MSWLSRLTNAIRSDRLDRDLDDELQYHLEARAAQLVREGADPASAAGAARRRLGNQLAIRESSREAKLFPWLESLLRDARFGGRILLREPGVTAAAVLSLSLAIGACTAAFSLLDALVLRPLPLPQPAQLVALSYPRLRTFPGAPPDSDQFSYPALLGFRQAAEGQADLFAMTVWGPPQRAVFDASAAGTPPEQLRAQWISADGMGILGVRPHLGRLFTGADDGRDEKRSVAVISHAFWMQRFAGNPAVLGRGVTLNGAWFQIVGVAQQGFTGLEPGVVTDLWLPLTTYAPAQQILNPANERFAIFGRLKPGVEAARLRQPLEAVFRGFRREEAGDPSRVGPELVDRFVNTPLKVTSAAHGHSSFLRWQFERPLWILAVVVALVLLVACSNVANLLLARAAARGREMAMRVALGAGRLRLVQQVFIECGLLAAVSSVVGLGAASFITPALVGLMGTAANPAYLDVQPDARALAFLALVCLAATSLFGLAPAWRASAADSTAALREAAGSQSARTGVLRAVLAAQVGFSFMVLFVAGLLLLSFHRLTSVDLGFSQKNVLVFDVDSGGGRGGGPRARAIQAELLDRLRRMPGVESAGTSGLVLLGGATSPVISAPVRVAGHGAERTRPQFLPVSPGFFSAMQIPLLAGRDFTAGDSEAAAPQAVIVNQFFAREFFPGQEAVGQRFERMVDDEGNYAPQEIVGVVGDAKYNNLREPAAPTIYFPAGGVGGAVEVRTGRNPLALAPALRKAIQGVDPSLSVVGVSLQSARIDESILEERMLALLGGFFGLIAVVLAAVGLHGVLSYSVVRRTREIGVRVALGAPFFAVVRMVTGDIALTVGIGLAAGLAGGLALARLVASTLFEVKPSDFASVALPLLCLLLACVVSALPPAMRAARVDPVEALRQQ
jgi:putative ABC transport system permease protein